MRCRSSFPWKNGAVGWKKLFKSPRQLSRHDNRASKTRSGIGAHAGLHLDRALRFHASDAFAVRQTENANADAITNKQQRAVAAALKQTGPADRPTHTKADTRRR